MANVLKASDPRAMNAKAIDSNTGEQLHHIVEVDLDTGKALCYQMESNGIAVRVASDFNGDPIIVEYEGLVVVEFGD